MRIILFISIFFISVAVECNDPVRVLIVTGGHDYDTAAFYEMFREMEGVLFDSVSYPAARDLLESIGTDIYDVLVFYDYQPDMPLEDSSVFQSLTGKGMPMLFLHHAICSFQRWEGYKRMVGGRYVMPGYGEGNAPLSDYKHDLDLNVKVVPDPHPVTAGVADFTIHDEGYSNLTILEEVIPLLTTQHPDCSDLVGWIHRYENSTTVYLLFGHDRHAYENQSLIKLIINSLHWLAEQETL